jgi:hypothetical protein
VSKTGKARKTAAPPEVAASPGYAISQRPRTRIEDSFGWMKTVGGLTQVKVRGLDKVRAVFVLAMAVYTIVRLPKPRAPRGQLLAPRGEVRPATGKAREKCPDVRPKPQKHAASSRKKSRLPTLPPKRGDFFSSLLSILALL